MRYTEENITNNHIVNSKFTEARNIFFTPDSLQYALDEENTAAIYLFFYKKYLS